MTAELRNESVIKVGEREIVLRPTFGCMMQIEAKTKKSFLKIINEVANGEGILSDTICVLKEAAKAGGNPLSDKTVEQMLESEGLMTIQMMLGDFFAKALYGGRAAEDESKKKEPVDTAQTESTGTSISESPSLT